MAICVMTGGSTGIGAATRKKLQDAGREVCNIDYKGGDFNADLSTREGCDSAIEEVFRRYPDGIDVMICNAGVGPTAPIKTIFSLKFFAAVQMAEGVRPLLKKRGGNVGLADLFTDYGVLHDSSVIKAGMDTIHLEGKMAIEMMFHHKFGFNGGPFQITSVRCQGDCVNYFIVYNKKVIHVTAFICELDSAGKIKRMNIYPL